MNNKQYHKGSIININEYKRSVLLKDESGAHINYDLDDINIRFCTNEKDDDEKKDGNHGMAMTECRLIDDPNDGDDWGFHIDFSKWDSYKFISYLEFIDCNNTQVLADWSKRGWVDDKGEHISGKHFTINKLGSPKWCRDVLQLNESLSQQFAAVIQHRIIQFEQHQPDISHDEDDVKCQLKISPFPLRI